VAKALRSLPCVESDSVQINFPKKQASFAIKPNTMCKVDDLKKKVADSGRGSVASLAAVK
jgi:hypothetical protein